jgi:hypothetical protein
MDRWSSVRWFAIGFVGIAAVLSLVAVHSHIKSTQQQGREAVYESIVRAYAETFKAGLSRREVEDRLQEKGNVFEQLCCIGEERFAFADLVKIGEEAAPWICSKQDVYVALEFRASGFEEIAKGPIVLPEGFSTQPFVHKRKRSDDPGDMLTNIRLYKRMDGCPDL